MQQNILDAINRLNDALNDAAKRQVMKDLIDVANAAGGGILPLASTSQTDCQAWVNACAEAVESA